MGYRWVPEYKCGDETIDLLDILEKYGAVSAEMVRDLAPGRAMNLQAWEDDMHLHFVRVSRLPDPTTADDDRGDAGALRREPMVDVFAQPEVRRG